MTPGQRLRQVELPLALPVDRRRRAHRHRLDRRHGHALDAGRRAQPRQLHLRRPADPQHGGDPHRLRRGGRPRAAARRPRPRRGLGPGGLAGAGAPRPRRVASCSRRAPGPLPSLPAHASGAAAARPIVVGRQDLHRAVRARRDPRRDRARAHRPPGPDARPRSARPWPSTRCGATRSTSTSTTPAPSGRRSWAARARAARAPQVQDEVRRWLAERAGVTLVASLGFENAYCFAVRRETARAPRPADASATSPATRRGSRSRATTSSSRARSGGRSKAAYGLAFRERRTMDPSLLYQAIAAGQVDAITAYSSDGRIDALGLVVLEDERHAHPALRRGRARLARGSRARRPTCSPPFAGSRARSTSRPCAASTERSTSSARAPVPSRGSSSPAPPGPRASHRSGSHHSPCSSRNPTTTPCQPGSRMAPTCAAPGATHRR